MYSKTKRIKQLLVLIMLSVVLFIGGIFGIAMDKKKQVTASAASSFSMLDGMALSVKPGDAYIRLTVYLTQDMYDNLSESTTTSKFLWITRYHPSRYYLMIRRNGGAGNELEVKYHIDPEHSYFSAEQLEFDEDDPLTAYLKFPFSADYETEYTYSCHLGHQTDYNPGGGAPSGYIWTIEDSAINTVTRSVAYVAGKVLEYDSADYNEEELAWFNELAGTTANEDTITVNLKYKRLLDHGYFETVTEQYAVNSLYALSPDMVYGIVADTRGLKSITEFNCTYVDRFLSKIVLQADSYTYVYDKTTEIGTLTITYRPFDYSNFAIRLQDNDWEDNTDLFMYLYSTDVSYTSIEWNDNEKVYMSFDYSQIVQQCYNSVGWLFELTADNFTIQNNSSHVTVTAGKNALNVSFYPEYEDELKDVSVFANAEIIEDYECTVNVNYTQLIFNGNTLVEEIATDTYSMMYSDYVKLRYWDDFCASEYYASVENALEVEELGEEVYCTPVNIKGNPEESHGSQIFNFYVEYDYNTLFAIQDTASGRVWFRACTNNSLTYTYEDLYLAPPDGYRLANLTSASTAVEILFNEEDYESCTVKLKTNSKQQLIIPITAEYSDKWNLSIVYMKPYKDTPFAVKTKEEVEVSIKDYPDIKALTKEDIAQLLGRKSLVVAGMVDANKEVKVVSTDDSTYTATVSYGVASLKQIDYDGNSKELQIPLTSYVDWCKSFGQDWTILYLNTKDTKYFQYSNEVNREDLYGFFSTAVFKEQVSDLNYWFRNTTGDGNMIIFDTRTVQGSKIYKFFGNLTSKGILGSILGYTGMAMCEILNDDNAIYQSYYFYLDGSTDENYLANGGADNAYDDDSAIENKGEDIADDVKDWWGDITGDTKSLWQKFRESKWDTVIVVALCVVGGLILLGFGWKFGKKYVAWVTEDNTKTKKSNTTKTTRKKK